MNQENVLDAYSLHILSELQRDAHQTIQQLAERVGLSATPCWKRVKDMEAAGIISGYMAVVDREKLGLKQLVVVEVNLAQHHEDVAQQFERAVAATPNIVRCLSTTGQADYILTVLVRDIQHYEQLLYATLFKLPGVTRVRSSIVLREVKFEVRLPVELPTGPTRARKRAAGA